MIRIVSDSTCDLSEELVEKYNVQVIPLHVVLGDQEYRDGKDITPEEIYRWSDEHKETPKTSAISLEDTCKVMKPILQKGEEIIAFCISEEMSSSGTVLRNAALELQASDRVTVIDSRSLSTGIGHLVVEAAILAASGLGREEIAAQIQELIPRVRASFVVDTLTYLRRGGRCSSVAAMAGGILKLHPMIEVKEGEMIATKKYRGNIELVISHYVQEMEPELKTAKNQRVFITHSGCPEEIVKKVSEYLEGLHHFHEILVTRAGGVVSSHCGPGTLGVLYIEGKKDDNF